MPTVFQAALFQLQRQSKSLFGKAEAPSKDKEAKNSRWLEASCFKGNLLVSNDGRLPCFWGWVQIYPMEYSFQGGSIPQKSADLVIDSHSCSCSVERISFRQLSMKQQPFHTFPFIMSVSLQCPQSHYLSHSPAALLGIFILHLVHIPHPLQTSLPSFPSCFYPDFFYQPEVQTLTVQLFNKIRENLEMGKRKC